MTVNPAKNRIYIVGEGFPSPAEGRQYLTNYRKALKHVRQGFTVLVDVRNLAPTSPEVQQCISESMQISVSLGLARVARVVSAKILAAMQMQRLTRQGQGTQHTAEHFATVEEAERYLDSAA